MEKITTIQTEIYKVETPETILVVILNTSQEQLDFLVVHKSGGIKKQLNPIGGKIVEDFSAAKYEVQMSEGDTIEASCEKDDALEYKILVINSELIKQRIASLTASIAQSKKECEKQCKNVDAQIRAQDETLEAKQEAIDKIKEKNAKTFVAYDDAAAKAKANLDESIKDMTDSYNAQVKQLTNTKKRIILSSEEMQSSHAELVELVAKQKEQLEKTKADIQKANEDWQKEMQAQIDSLTKSL